MEKEIYTLKVYNTLTKQYEDVVVTKKVYDTYRRTEWNIKDNDESFYDHEIQISGLIGGEGDGYENFREFLCRGHMVRRQQLREAPQKPYRDGCKSGRCQ